jgi:hypothetical protein
MKYQAFCLFCFILLILGFILFTFLGSPRYKEGMENNTITFTSNTGASATLTTDENGIKIIIFTNTDGNKVIYSYNPETDNVNSLKTTTYVGPNGGKAILVEGTNGMYMLEIFSSTGTLIVSLVAKKDDSTSSTTDGSTSSSNTDDSTSSSNTDGSSNSNSNSNYTSSSNYDNYNHYSGSSYPTIFYGPNGGTARVIQTDNNSTIVITYKNGITEIYYIKNPNNSSSVDPTVNTYYGPNGSSAKMITSDNGKKAVSITGPNGSTVIYTEDNIQDATTSTNTNNSDDNFDQSQYYDSNGGQSSTYSSVDSSMNTMNPNTSNQSSMNANDYSNYLPPGIPKRMIPPGQEDLYILKSEVVPPVCPACPEPIVKCPGNFDPDKIPPCPPCARCPEPAFDCKKVPNYSAFNPDYLPVPALNDFTTFGM